ncbi:energy transducer TonB [Flavobacterium sp.]|uniref:energy transducer TonB n=1 Tax=Flavobacterium sp. TaxID=239 RepID=UPI002FDB4C1E
MFKIKILFFLLGFNLVTAQTDETENQENVPFQIIEDLPIIPGCEEIALEERRNCFQLKIFDHIKKNFNYPAEAFKKNIKGRVIVTFAIEKDGSVSIDNVRGPHPLLENEAKRIISLLPAMKPGFFRDKPVRVTMSIPITFHLDK